jgi:hypothetical protein
MLVAAVVAATWGTPTVATALAAAVLLAITVVVSVVMLVPINNRSATSTAERHPTTGERSSTVGTSCTTAVWRSSWPPSSSSHSRRRCADRRPT